MPNEEVTSGRLYGKGVFTSLAIVEGEPFLWDKHWTRLESHATVLSIDISKYSEAAVCESLHDQIEASGLRNGRARITVFDESPSRIWSNEADEKSTSLSIIVAERRLFPENFTLSISPHRINTSSPLAGIKSCNYLEHLLAYEEASKRGFHEAIRLNEREEIASACMANVFWAKDDKLFTPSLKTGCLPGTTREYILENMECEEVEVGIEELYDAERIFLTSAGIGVVSVAAADGRGLVTSDHPLSSLLPY